MDQNQSATTWLDGSNIWLRFPNQYEALHTYGALKQQYRQTQEALWYVWCNDRWLDIKRSQCYYRHGIWSTRWTLGYFINTTSNTLNMWNSSRCLLLGKVRSKFPYQRITIGCGDLFKVAKSTSNLEYNGLCRWLQRWQLTMGAQLT